MKFKDLRQKYNGLLQKFIRLFSLTVEDQDSWSARYSMKADF